jgi:membrane-associated HD superfamily phosphohydrolase
MLKTFAILLVIFFLQFPALNVCNGESPKTHRKPSQNPQFITSDEATAIARREIDERMKEIYERRQKELAEQKLPVSEYYLKIAQGILSAIAWLAGVGGVILGLLGFFGIKFSKDWITKTIKNHVEEKMKTLFEEQKVDFQEQTRKQIEERKQVIEFEIQEARKDVLAKAETN